MSSKTAIESPGGSEKGIHEDGELEVCKSTIV